MNLVINTLAQTLEFMDRLILEQLPRLRIINRMKIVLTQAEYKKYERLFCQTFSIIIETYDG